MLDVPQGFGFPSFAMLRLLPQLVRLMAGMPTLTEREGDEWVFLVFAATPEDSPVILPVCYSGPSRPGLG
jgi:hypothetical protein